MNKSRKLLSLLLTLAMVLALLGGSFAFADEAEETRTFVPADALAENEEFVIVAEYEGANYALGYDAENSALTAVPVTIEDGKFTPASKDIIWFAREGDTLESAGTPEVFIFAGSYGLMTYSSGRTFVYDGENKRVLLHQGNYCLGFDGTAFATAKEDGAATISIYHPSPDYVLADAFTEDDQFVIVTKVDGKNIAFAYDGALTAKEVQVEGDIAIPEDDTVIWAAREDQAIESVASPDTFIYAGSYGLMTYTTGRTFVYDPETKQILMHNLYYLSYDAAAGAFTQVGYSDIDKASEFEIYRRVMPKGSKEDQFVPDGTPHDPIVRDATKNDDGSITLAFVSDIHYATTYTQNNLQVWLDNVEEKIGYIDAMGSCGDMGSAYSASPEEYWANVQAIYDYMDDNQVGTKIGDVIYTFGNHEWYPSAGGKYMEYYENPTAQRLLRVGEGIRTPDYIFYCLGSGAISAKMSQGYSDEDIATIDAYLSTAPTDIPIFVLTHFPIHCWTDRLTEGADKLLEVLNKYPNIIVIWGHNHSDFDPFYQNGILHAGDTIEIDNKGTTRTVNFTYLPAGCISDFEYTGVDGGSAWVLAKGLIVTIGADKSITYDYYTMDGDKMPENGPWLVEFREGVNYETLKLETVEDGAAAVAPEAPEFPNYTFTGWDVDFNNVTEHTVVTGIYDYTTGLDPNYVYITVQEQDGIARDGEGNPILMYPVPYVDGITPEQAVKALETEVLGEEAAAEVVKGGYGYISGIWGYAPNHGAWVMDPSASSGYISATDKMAPGGSYYILAYNSTGDDGDGVESDYYYTSYLSPFVNEVEPKESIDMYGESWMMDESYKYHNIPLNGTVWAGPSLDELEDTGIVCEDGHFSISFDEGGTYYVAVKSEGVGLAATKVEVTKYYPVILPPAPPAEPEPEKKLFDDVKDESAYFFAPVYWAAENGVATGKTETTFDPEGSATRADMLTFLWRAAGSPASTAEIPFTDVESGSYYETAVRWAWEKGITLGVDATHYAPETTVTRGQVLTFLCRALKTGEVSGENIFEDVAEGAYYYEPVLWALGNQMTIGVDETHFAPMDFCKRADIVTFLYRFYSGK